MAQAAPADEPVNILFNLQSVALAVTEDADCSSSIPPISFERIRPYSNGDFLPFVSTSRFEWILHDNGFVESVHCPGKVLDVSGKNCGEGEVILYQQKETGTENQMWLVQEVTSSLAGFFQKASVEATEPTYALESVHCLGEFIQVESPVQIQMEIQQEFKSSALLLEPAINNQAP